MPIGRHPWEDDDAAGEPPAVPARYPWEDDSDDAVVAGGPADAADDDDATTAFSDSSLEEDVSRASDDFIEYVTDMLLAPTGAGELVVNGDMSLGLDTIRTRNRCGPRHAPSRQPARPLAVV